MVGRDHVDGAVRERLPNRIAMFGAAQRRIADVLRAVGFEKSFFGQIQIDGPRLGEHRAASGARAANFVDSVAARQMHEVGGRAGQLGHRERAPDCGGLGQRRPAGGEMRHVIIAGGEQALGAESDQVLVFGVNGEQRAAVAGDLERTEEVARALSKPRIMKILKLVTPRSTTRGISAMASGVGSSIAT